MTNRIREYQKGDIKALTSMEFSKEDMRELRWFLENHQITEMHLLQMNSRMFTWETECGPVCVFGSTPEGDGSAIIWSMPSVEALKRWRWWARNGAEYFDMCGEGHTFLHNYKDVRNKRHITWLRKFGFTFLPEVELDGVKVYPFMRIQT